MASLINRFFRKKPSGNIPPSNRDLSLETIRTDSSKQSALSEEKASVNPLIKTHLELSQFLVGVGQSVGIERDNNEDALFTLTTNLVSDEHILNFGLYIVADGMGGHENGELASNIAVGQLTSHVINTLYLPLLSDSGKSMELSIQEIMHSGVVQAHQTIKKETLGGGTTLTAALILGEQMIIAHVGDSRAYSITSDGNLHLLTHDHSIVKRLEEIGQISPDQASSHPQRNVLYRALGQGEPFEPDIINFHLEQGSQLLLCTDGLWNVASEREIVKVIRSSQQPQLACQSLIQLANSVGGPDNISVIIVQIPE